MKKLISIILAVVLLVSVMPLGTLTLTASAETEYTESYYTYTVSNGEATITDVDTSISGAVTIPSTLGGYPVTSIGNLAFGFCSSFESITIPSSVTSIGYNAFTYCTGLTSITIPDSVTSIVHNSFYNTGYYNNIDNWENGVLYIGNHLVDVANDSVPSKYSVKNGTKTIAHNAFGRCSGLTSITVPDSVENIGEFAFADCSELESITLSKSLQNIEGFTFDQCKKLTNINIPNSVKEIGYAAFRGCSSLTSINIPSSVEYIDQDVFEDCDISNVYITDISAWCNIIYNNEISGNSGQTIYCYPACFADNLYLNGELITDLVIPPNVTNIPEFAFSFNSITSITIPESVTIIPPYAFAGSSITSITIPNSVTSIGDGVFHDCTSLTSITIPNSVTSIGHNAFYDTGYYNNTDNWENGILYIGNCLIEADHALSGEYNIKKSTTVIANYAFSYSGVASITIPNSVTSIGDGAFECSDITSITIPDSVTSIGSGAFSNCNNLTSITIPNSVTSIGDYAFFYCDSLTSIKISDNVTSIGVQTFHGCTGLTSITIPDSVTSIGIYAFRGCTGLTSVTIPNSVTNIGDYAFKECDKLTIYGIEGSYAQTYANENNIPFSAIKINTNLFPDTYEGDWYYDAVKYVAESGIMKGYANGKFGTSDGIQRQDFLVMLARFDGVNLEEYSGGSKFGDVSSGSYYEAAVNWGYQNGIVTGYQNGNFGVSDMINREQIVTFLYRYANYKGINTAVSAQSAQAIKVKYPDYNNVSDYARDAVLWAINRGAISGKNGNEIAPFAGAQRCEVAQIMYNINKNNIF